MDCRDCDHSTVNNPAPRHLDELIKCDLGHYIEVKRTEPDIAFKGRCAQVRRELEGEKK